LVIPGWDSMTSVRSASSTFIVIRTVCINTYYLCASAASTWASQSMRFLALLGQFLGTTRSRSSFSTGRPLDNRRGRWNYCRKSEWPQGGRQSKS
jgi:hypothetical protein